MNLGLLMTAENKSSISDAFVILQRPFPVMKIFVQSFSFFSNRVTFCPFLAAKMAAIIPAAPPPTTITLLMAFFYFHGHSITDMI